MNSVTHREMRNDSGALLRRVAAGETIMITNHGRPVAVIGPVGDDRLDDLESRGQLRRAIRPVSELRDIRRRPASRSSAELLRDVRGDR